MDDFVTVSIRLPASMADELDDEITVLAEEQPEHRWTRSSAFRVALVHWLGARREDVDGV